MSWVKNLTKTLLSDNWYKLYKYEFDIRGQAGDWQRHSRECYDRGNGAAIFLYDPSRGTVILTRQFRLPSYVNGNETGLMVEVCAGLLDGDSPEDCIRKEAEEEVGYRVTDVNKVFEAYMSPGAVTEIIHFFTGQYSPDMKINEGGGLESEGENIEVLEMRFEEAYAMIESGDIKDAKTIMLLQYAKMKGLALIGLGG